MTTRVIALRLLSLRDYTTRELRAKLLDRECAEDEVDETLRALTREGLLDDRRAAAAHVRSASRIKSRGRLRIARELEARGLDRSAVREALEELPAADEAAALQRVLERRRVPAQLSMIERRRLFQHLLRRGFSADLISSALRRRGGDEN